MQARTAVGTDGAESGDLRAKEAKVDKQLSKNKLGFHSAKAAEGSQAVRPRTRCPPQAQKNLKRVVSILCSSNRSMGCANTLASHKRSGGRHPPLPHVERPARDMPVANW